MTPTSAADFDTDRWLASEGIIALEREVLGLVIGHQPAAETAASLVKPEHFAKPAHSLVYEAVVNLVDNGQPVSPAAVLDELTRTGRADKVGHGAGVFSLLQHAGTGPELPSHCRRIVGDWQRRELNLRLRQAVRVTEHESWDAETDIDRCLDLVEGAIQDQADSGAAVLGDMLQSVLDEIEQELATDDLVVPPYRDLRRFIPGLRGGELVAVGARPGVGKSTTITDWARHAAIENQLPTVVFSLEMGKREITKRILAAEAGVPLKAILGHTLSTDQWQALGRHISRLHSAPLTIVEAPGCTVGQIRNRLRGMMRQAPPRLVVVDYWQIMKSQGKAENRQQELSEIARALKILAMDFDIPIILAAQLNRLTEHRADKRPILSDFRESGALEQDADIAILVHRPDMYEQESPRAGEADLIVAKQRNGPQGVAAVAFQGHYARFVDMAHGSAVEGR
ncbi:replicative DNA helicase [Sphaerisporangium sp. NPDC049002]|uniref:replicative DNA helicase n=1 Tax=Sphaerisporangium sp. NPDC049002 TaxID=3155392 RepID=UPI0033EC2895